MIGGSMGAWGGALVAVCMAAGCATTEGVRGLSARGLEYRLQEIREPRPNRAHILRVDLSIGQAVPMVVMGDDPDGSGPAETALTSPMTLAGGGSVLAFVNTNPWDSFPDAAGEKNRRWYEGQPVDIHGLAASDGRLRSAAQSGAASVWVNARGRVVLDDVPAEGTVVEGMSGFQHIVKEGAVVVAPGGAIHPRTGLGVDRDGKVLWLVVVDGRQESFSEGMTVHELARLLLEQGCWDAANMDGGGSSVMGLMGEDGRLQVVNSPSDRSPLAPDTPKIRPLPMILTIREN